MRALDSIESDTNLIRIRPDKLMSNTFVKDRCASHFNGEVFYFDNNHLSNRVAEIISKLSY